jgi:hypothetical protein
MTSLNVNFLIDEYLKSKNDPFFWGTIVLAPFMILIFFCALCDCVSNSYDKVEYSNHIDEKEKTSDNVDKNNNDYEEDSADDATSIESEYSKTSDEVEDSPTQEYTSVLFKSFSLLTKKQLLKMTGSKYKNKNKDELVVIAMYKFISKAVENSQRLPKGVKLFVKENKHSMKQELLELYQIESIDY